MNDGPPSRPSRASRPVLIGAFVLGAIVLIVAAVLASADGRLFARKDSVVMHFSGSIFGLQAGARACKPRSGGVCFARRLGRT